MTPRRWPWFALATVAFGTSYALLPLYSSNQNHHFLIGIARAGEGWLREDWLASTVDPFPVFTALVTVVHRYLTDALHYLIYYLLFGAYAYGLMGIAERAIRDPTADDPAMSPVSATRRTRTERLAFLAILCVLHNEVVGYLLGIDLRHIQWWQMTHWGVAEQEIFGHSAFQASSFGMLLPLAILWFLDRRPLAATALIGAVLLVHFSYVFTVAAITVAFMFLELRRTRRARRPAIIGGIALACAVPALVYVLVALGPTSPQVSRTAAAIIVSHIPQEAVPSSWLGLKAHLQLALIAVGLALASGTELLPILLAPLLAGVALTAAELASGNPQLALLFPWRVTVLLVPISTALVVRAIIVKAVSAKAAARPARLRLFERVSIAALVVSCLLGAARMVLHFSYFYDYHPMTAFLDRVVPSRWRSDFANALRPDALPMMRFVRETAVPGNLFVIPPELERFRLVAGAPALADLKSHPYKDAEVLEWRRRLDLVGELYDSKGDCAVVALLEARYQVTHVVADARIRPLNCPGLTAVYEDDVFVVYLVERAANARLDVSRWPDSLVADDRVRAWLFARS